MSAGDMNGLGYGDHRYDRVLNYENEMFHSVIKATSNDSESSLCVRFVREGEMRVVAPPTVYMSNRSNEEVDDSKFTYGMKRSESSESSGSDTKTSENVSCDSDSSADTLKSVTDTPKVVNKPVIE